MIQISAFEESRRQLKRLRKSPSASPFSRITRAPSVEPLDPSNRFAPSTWSAWQGVKFPDLETKSVFKKGTLLKHNPEPAASLRRNPAVDAWAIGEPTGTQRPVRPLTLALPQQIQAVDSAPDFLIEPLSRLVSIPGLTLTLMTESHNDGWSVAINAMQDDNRAIDSRLFLRDSHVKHIRHACVVHIELGHQSLGLLVLLEANPIHAYLLTEPLATEEGVALALETAAIRFLTESTSLASDTLQQLRRIVNKRS